ncbi:MAG: ABC transporter ATP-binding protein [Thermodesulfovibrionales bacterium]|nr:ABC transporter ATP-binding protein [Thermodesulfovibrionales bacterium]
MDNDNAISIVGLTKTYGNDSKKVIALNDINLDVEKGTVFGLLGPNGAGKTTMIKILTTLSKPDKGTCKVGGFDVVSNPLMVKKMIGVVPQENNLDRELTAYQNMLIYGMLHKVTDLDTKISKLLQLVGLDDKKNTVVSHFSGGMQRRLLIARALLSDPSLLFLDEPTIGLDPQIRRQFWDIIRKIKKDGSTVILTTHYIEEAEALCDKVGILSKGRLVAVDTPNNLKILVGQYVVNVIDSDGRLTQYMFKTKEEAQAKALEFSDGVTIRRSNLEDVFVKLTGERIE